MSCKKATLNTVTRKGCFVRQFEGAAKHPAIRCFKFWQLVAAVGCPFSCSYCFLQSTPSYVFGAYPLSGAIFANWEDMVEDVKCWLDKPTQRMLLVGELQDGMAFEQKYKSFAGLSLTEMLIPLFSAQDSHELNFLTKSTCIQFAKKLEPCSQVIFSWSVNADEVSRKWEKGAPSPARRLEAAKTMKALGWRIRLRLDPMIPIPNWRDSYARLISAINELQPEMVTVGTLRASKNLRSMAKHNERDYSVFDYLSEKDPAGFKWRLPLDTQLKMYGFVKRRLSKKIKLALCKEDSALWHQLDMSFGGCNCLVAE